jgi:hypothetical protein
MALIPYLLILEAASMFWVTLPFETITNLISIEIVSGA